MCNYHCQRLIQSFNLFFFSSNMHHVSQLFHLSLSCSSPPMSLFSPWSLFSSVTPFLLLLLLLLLPDWTASTRSMWRSAWLQANAPRSHSSSPSTTRWRWNRPLSWWRVEGESSCLLLCLPLFPCSKYWVYSVLCQHTQNTKQSKFKSLNLQ